MPTRAHTLSITAHDGLDFDGLWAALHPLWSEVQRAANAAIRTYAAADDAEMIEGKRGKMTLAKPPKINAYAAACAAAPLLADGMCGAISDAAQRARCRYMADRWAVQVAISQSMPTFHRPLPLSIRRQDWRSKAAPNGVFIGPPDEQGRNVFLARFALPGMKREARPTIRFVCKTGRDARLLTKIASGEYPARTLEILPPGWKRKGAIRAKIVYDRPDAEPREVKGALHVATAPDCLLTATFNGGEPIRWHVRWLRSRIIAYEQWRRERGEDLKHERRTSAGRMEVYREDVGRRAEKHRNRVRATLQQVASEVVGRALRCGCGVIEYDDRDRSWTAQFPWADLRDRIKQCAETKGVGFTEKKQS